MPHSVDKAINRSPSPHPNQHVVRRANRISSRHGMRSFPRRVTERELPRPPSSQQRKGTTGIPTRQNTSAIPQVPYDANDILPLRPDPQIRMVDQETWTSLPCLVYQGPMVEAEEAYLQEVARIGADIGTHIGACRLGNLAG